MKLHVSSGNHHSDFFSLIEGGLLGASPIFFAEFLLERFRWFLTLKNDFEYQNFVIFKVFDFQLAQKILNGI